MKIDEYGCMVIEQASIEGGRGDSMAESARMNHLCHHLAIDPPCDLNKFITVDSYIRHPFSIWPSSDTSVDQLLPWFLSMKIATPDKAFQMKQRIIEWGWRAPNNDVISPAFYAELQDSQFLRVSFLLAQLAIFKIPFRWSDSKRRFEPSFGSSADVLNFLHCAIYAPLWLRKRISKSWLMQKVSEYYWTEPRPMVIPYYEKFIDKFFGKKAS